MQRYMNKKEKYTSKNRALNTESSLTYIGGTMNKTREQNIPDVIRCRVSKIWFKCHNMLNKMN